MSSVFGLLLIGRLGCHVLRVSRFFGWRQESLWRGCLVEQLTAHECGFTLFWWGCFGYGIGADIDECLKKTKCQCPDCQCSNTWGGYDCQCGSDLLYISEHDTCISKSFCLLLLRVRENFVLGGSLEAWFSWYLSLERDLGVVIVTLLCLLEVFLLLFKLMCLNAFSYSLLCAGKQSQQSKLGWVVTLIVLAVVSVIGVVGYTIYKYRLRVCV